MNICLDQFNKLYPTNEACLKAVFKPKPCKCGRNKWYPLKSRKAYSCACGELVHPLANTIFRKSSTPLKTWFYVMFLMAQSKSGLSAAFIQRITGVSYKCAWRMCHKIRELMKETSKLRGHVEADETFFKAKAYRNSRLPQGFFLEGSRIVFGVAARSGGVRVRVIPTSSSHYIKKALLETVSKGSHVHSDGWSAYRNTPKYGYKHTPHIHYKKTPFEPGVNRFQPTAGKTTQQIENFWCQLKRGIYGTYRSVKYLQAYCDEFAFRYSYRNSEVPMFEVLLRRV